MKFGWATHLSVPRPWTRESERQVYLDALEQARVADEVGFDYAWAPEHHFLEEYSHSPSPEVFLTAVAMQTKRIRIGHAIAVCVPEYNSPIRIAERTATLDIISGGRLEVGTGRSATWTELGGFRSNPDLTKKAWDEFVHVIPKMWTEERFAYQGQFFSMPERAVVPKPYQNPHPPLWVAVNSPGTELDAAERGMGSLGLSFAPMAQQAKTIERYRHVIKNCDPVGSFVNEHVATTNFMFCHEDDEQSVKIGTPIANAVASQAQLYVHPGEAVPSTPATTQGLLSALRRGYEGPTRSEGSGIGNPDYIIRQLKLWESIGVDSINFLVNFMNLIPQEQVLKSMRLFAKEVIPHFSPKTSRVAVQLERS